MILSQTAQYALRIMTHIALVQGARPVRAKEIADNIRSPNAYVSKVLRRLVTGGLLKAERGHGGGFVLARPAEKILFYHVLDAVQPTREIKQCIFGWRRCNPDNPCILHHRWNAVSSSFEEWARKTSLSDIQKDAAASEWLTRAGEGLDMKKISAKSKGS